MAANTTYWGFLKQPDKQETSKAAYESGESAMKGCASAHAKNTLLKSSCDHERAIIRSEKTLDSARPLTVALDPMVLDVRT